jgi:HK97 family phage major capsid protein
MPKWLTDLLAKQESLRAQLTEFDSIDEPTDEQIESARAALDEFDEVSRKVEEGQTFETRRSAAIAQQVAGETESGADSGVRSIIPVGGGRRPADDPFAADVIEAVRSGFMGGDDMRRRAVSFVESIPESGYFGDSERAKALSLVDDSPAIARHALLTGSPAYRSAFEKLIANPTSFPALLEDDEARAFRAAMSLTAANGGYLVPFTLDPTIILTNTGTANPFRSQANVKTITTDDWNGVTSAGVTAAWLAEGTEVSDNTPTFAQPSITAHKAAAWLFGSYEVLADSGFASEVSRLLGDAKDRLEGTAFALGTGSGQPHGVIDSLIDGSAITTSAATDTFAVGDVYATQTAVNPRHRSKAVWYANQAIMAKIRQFDTYGGSSFWANLGASQPETLLGRPIYESSDMDGVINGTAENYVLGYVDMSNYVIVDRVGMTVMYEPMVKSTANGRPTGQAGWFAYWRVGADLIDAANSGRVLNVT